MMQDRSRASAMQNAQCTGGPWQRDTPCWCRASPTAWGQSLHQQSPSPWAIHRRSHASQNWASAARRVSKGAWISWA